MKKSNKSTPKKKIIILIIGLVILLGLVAGIGLYVHNRNIQEAELVQEQIEESTRQALSAIDEKMEEISTKESLFTIEQKAKYETLKGKVAELTMDTPMERIQQVGAEVYGFNQEFDQ